ncbi:MAG TPA: DUF6580 family putative transport protein [Candidatus Binatia bacterium]|jgi:hypothetical protein|nr:DUF6580 family putative transport protein [Candidatus Binatia bacterium]
MARFLIISVVVLIICLARVLPHPIPVSISALALFASVYLPQKRSAFLIFFGGMFISDFVLGLHSLIPVVYASLVPILCLGFGLKKNLRAPNIAGATILGSLLYFFLTNFGVWVLGGCDWTQAREYPPTFAGLLSAFAAAFPGLPKRILWDLVGSSLLFGIFPWAYKSLARFDRLWLLRRPQPYSAM